MEVITHEPKEPLSNYPYSHVKVEDVFDNDCLECVKVSVHRHQHYLHRTTAFSLYMQLQDYFKSLSDEEKELMISCGSELGEELL